MPIEEYPDMLYGAAWMQSAVTSRIAQEAQDTDLFHELKGYLTSPLEPFRSLPDAAVIRWWKDHSIVYPTLTRMA
jgi:hypothetical protein